jgi:phage terminase large subunit-like protein
MGRRWGKTYMAGVYALAVADYGGAVAWVVPTYKNARVPWRFAEAMIAQVAGRLRMNRTERVIEFPSGGRLSIYSADNDVALRGEAFDLVIVDEAAQVREETYTDVLMPTLADRDGRMVLISTPRGRNWFWREWLRGRSDESGCASWTAPSSANPMPTIRRAAEMARDRVPERTYRQEWLAEFIEDGGSVFRNIAACLTAPLDATPEAHKGHHIIAGADWARESDYTTFSVGCATCRQEVARDRFNQVDYHVQTQRLQALAERWQPVSILTELNSIGLPVHEMLQRMGLPVVGFTTTAQSKPPLIENMALAFERGEWAWQADPVWTAELEAYERTVSPTTGRSSYSAPAGGHDDSVIARALMLWQATNYVPLLF